MTNPRQITKYPNRRLYDKSGACYITLADVRAFVIEREEFIVNDRASHADITDQVLLQVVLEQEQRGKRALSREFLLQTIRESAHSVATANGEQLKKPDGPAPRPVALTL
jgi:polyhydroxyalkanoate synthesis repressor PhaR